MNQPRKHARKHHYVPQFYLAGFTATGNKDGQLWVFDKETGRNWPKTPFSLEMDPFLILIAGA